MCGGGGGGRVRVCVWWGERGVRVYVEGGGCMCGLVFGGAKQCGRLTVCVLFVENIQCRWGPETGSKTCSLYKTGVCVCLGGCIWHLSGGCELCQ